MESVDIGRRMRAARALAGFEHIADLAKAIGEEGLSAATLGDIERGERPWRLRELRAIAVACQVPLGFLRDPDPFRPSDEELEWLGRWIAREQERRGASGDEPPTPG